MDDHITFPNRGSTPTMNKETEMTQTPETLDEAPRSQRGTFTRRQTVTGIVGAGLVTAGIVQAAMAQTTDATPEATPGTGGTTGSSDDSTAASMVDAATEAIDTVQTDRDAVASEIETTTVDAFLEEASQLRDSASTATDEEDAMRQAFAAIATARVARRVIMAELSYPGLPSQEERATEMVTRAGEAIDSLTETTIDSPLIDADFYVTTGQALYGRAGDDLAGDAYAQAALRARAAEETVAIPYRVLGFTGPGGRRDHRGPKLPFDRNDDQGIDQTPGDTTSDDVDGIDALSSEI